MTSLSWNKASIHQKLERLVMKDRISQIGSYSALLYSSSLLEVGTFSKFRVLLAIWRTAAKFPLFTEEKQKWRKCNITTATRDAEVVFCKLCLANSETILFNLFSHTCYSLVALTNQNVPRTINSECLNMQLLAFLSWPSLTNFFHHSLCNMGQEPLHVHNVCKAKTDPNCPHPLPLNPLTQSLFWGLRICWPFPGELPGPGVRCNRRLWASSSPGSNLRDICCYLGNVLCTLHGHICTSALTSWLFLAPAHRWRLLWWCHAGFQNKSDCLSWVTLPARFSCHVCLCLFICQTGLFWAAPEKGRVLLYLHLQLCCVIIQSTINSSKSELCQLVSINSVFFWKTSFDLQSDDIWRNSLTFY